MTTVNYLQLTPTIFTAFSVIFILIYGHLNFITQHFDDFDWSIAADSLESTSFLCTVSASLGLLIPYGCCHVQNLSINWNWEVHCKHMEMFLLPAMVILMQCFNIYFVTEVNTSTLFYICNYFAGTYIQLIALYNVVMALQMQLAKTSWKESLSVGLSSFLATIGMLIKYSSALDKNYSNIKLNCSLLFALSIVCNCFIGYCWWQKYIIAIRSGIQNQPHFIALLEIMLMSFYLIAFISLDSFSDGYLYQLDKLQVVGIQVLIIIIFFLISEIINEGNKNINKFSEQALETKRAFVRYVSHEIRTPMNTTQIGLQLLEKEIIKFVKDIEINIRQVMKHTDEQTTKDILSIHQNTLIRRAHNFGVHQSSKNNNNNVSTAAVVAGAEDHHNQQQQEEEDIEQATQLSKVFQENHQIEESLLELIRDTGSSCHIAIEILNDLLMYEKIDGGLLVLETKEILLWPFVLDVLKLFDVQARAMELKLFWTNDIPSDIFVTIDTYKLSQVIRNLISNALKFSKAGQKVEVKAEILDSQTIKARNNRDKELPSSSYHFRPKNLFPIGGMSYDDLPSISYNNRVAHHSPSEKFMGLNNTDQSSNRNNNNNNSSNAASPFQKQYSSVYSSHSSVLKKNTKIVPHKESIGEHSVPEESTMNKQVQSKSKFKSKMFPYFKQSSSGLNGNDTKFLRISVTDKGPGISKENQKRLFNEIVQFDAAKLQQGKGSGIGLWISNRIMKLHGGNIGVESAGEGCGSTFYIDIPITRMKPRSLRNIFHGPVREFLQKISTVPSPSQRPPPSHKKPSSSSSFVHNMKSGKESNNSNNSGNGGDIMNELIGSSSRLSKKPRGASFLAAAASSMLIPMRRGSLSSQSSQNSHPSNSSPSLPVTAITPSSSSTNHRSGSLFNTMFDAWNLESMKAIVMEEPSRKKPFANQLTVHEEQQHHDMKKRVLIVDDSLLNRKFLVRSILDMFDVCDEAENGEIAVTKALKMMDEHPQHYGYDILITDYSMPVMDGVESIRRLRKSGYEGNIIGLTGNTDVKLLEEFEQAGADLVLIKPFQTDDLRKIIQDMFQEIHCIDLV